MINKNGFTMSLGMFAMLVFALSFASASVVISDLDFPSTAHEDDGSFTFTFDITYSGAGEDANVSFSTSTTNFGSVSIPAETLLNGSESEQRTVTGTISGFSNQGGNDIDVTINAVATTGETDTDSFSTTINGDLELCEFGEQGSLEIDDFDINNKGSGSDDEWEPLDEIELEFDIENTGDDRVSDVMVEIFIVDEDGNDITNDFDFDDEEVDLGSVRDDDTETATFIIPEVPSDIEEGNLRIYLKVYSDGEEDEHCTSDSTEFSDDDYHEVEFVREDDPAVVVREQDLNSAIVAACGQEDIEISFPVFNIGSDKEDGVLVNLYNAELGIDEYVSLGSLSSGKKDQATFLIDIPEEVSKERYRLDIFTFFEYDEDEDELEESSYDSSSYDDLDKDWQLQLEIVDCSVPEPSVNALLDSSARVGEELVIRTSITNNGDAGSFFVSVEGIQGWAELVSVTPQSVNLAASETTEVIVRLNPLASGFQTFAINTVVDGESFSQPVSVNIAEEEGVASNFGFGDNALYYTVIVLVVLIILIIIMIIVRVLRGSGSRNDRF